MAGEPWGASIEEIYHRYVDELTRFAFLEVSLYRVLMDQDVAPARYGFEGPLHRQKRRFRGVVRTEIATLQRGFVDEFQRLTDATAAAGPIADHVDEVVATDPFHERVDPARREAFRADLRRDLVRAGRALEPVVGVDDALGWMRRHWSLEGAQHRLMRWFARSTTYAAHVDDLSMTVDTSSVAPVPVDTVDYARETVRVLERGRDYVARVIAADLEAAYAADIPARRGAHDRLTTPS